MPIESFAAFFEYRRETLRGLLCRSLLLADKVHRRQFLLVIHDLHLLVISDIAKRHRGVEHVVGCIEPLGRSARDHTFVPLTDHTLRGAFRTLGRGASTRA